MKCKVCSEQYSSPHVIDGKAYFVCEHCGDAYEIDDYQELTPEQALAKFEKEYNIKFPKDYIELSQSTSSWVFQDPSLDVDLMEDYFEQGCYEL